MPFAEGPPDRVFSLSSEVRGIQGSASVVPVDGDGTDEASKPGSA